MTHFHVINSQIKINEIAGFEEKSEQAGAELSQAQP